MTTLFIDPEHKIVTRKAESLVNLEKRGFPIPVTLICGSTKQLLFLMRQGKVDQYKLAYVRLIFSDDAYPHYFSSLCRPSEIPATIRELEARVRSRGITRFDIVVQPFIQFLWAGGLLVKGRYMLLEVVNGSAVALFRKGFLGHRILLDKNGKLLRWESERQPYAVSWRKHGWDRVKSRKCAFEVQKYFREIAKASTLPHRFYELGFTANATYYLEHKHIPIKSYPTVLHGSIARPFPVYLGSERLKCRKRIRLSYPAFEHLDDAKEKALWLVRKGAYLSHLAYAMAVKQNDCIFG